jgi:hypothetical protein
MIGDPDGVGALRLGVGDAGSHQTGERGTAAGEFDKASTGISGLQHDLLSSSLRYML